MTAIKDITEHSQRSEKAIEKYLVSQIDKLGGMALKYASPQLIGMPDRLCLMPGGIAFWVELKSKGKRPRPLQRIRADKLRGMGQKVYVADSKEEVDAIIIAAQISKGL